MKIILQESILFMLYGYLFLKYTCNTALLRF